MRHLNDLLPGSTLMENNESRTMTEPDTRAWLAAWKGESLSIIYLETTIAANDKFDRDNKGAGAVENMSAYT